MKLREKIKRFWTLNVHNHEGFTLVELIIVIAILAILSSVAVVGYSSYVKKANMQADRTMIKEIENALMLAYYNGDLTAGDRSCIVLSVGTVATGITADSNMDKALIAAFGANYATTLQLKHSGWKGGIAQVYKAFKNSGFYGNEDQLMGDIQDLTDAVGTFLDTQGTDFMFFMGGDDWTAFQQKHNIDMSDGKQVSNATALFVAEKTLKDLDRQKFIDAWCNANSPHQDRHDFGASNFNPAGIGTLQNLAAHYARAEALAAYIDANKTSKGYTLNLPNKADGTPYLSMREWFADNCSVDGTDPNAVINSMETATGKFANVMGDSKFVIIGDYLTSEQAKADAAAYLSMLGAINDNAGKLAEDLDEDKLYDGGSANDMLDSYLTAGEAVLDANGNSIVPEGSVAVVVTVTEKGCAILVFGMTE